MMFDYEDRREIENMIAEMKSEYEVLLVVQDEIGKMQDTVDNRLDVLRTRIDALERILSQ